MLRIAVTALSLAVTVVRHPLVRVGIRTLASNPKAREKAMNVTREAAYNAGVLARRIVPGRRL